MVDYLRAGQTGYVTNNGAPAPGVTAHWQRLLWPLIVTVVQRYADGEARKVCTARSCRFPDCGGLQEMQRCHNIPRCRPFRTRHPRMRRPIVRELREAHDLRVLGRLAQRPRGLQPNGGRTQCLIRSAFTRLWIRE